MSSAATDMTLLPFRSRGELAEAVQVWAAQHGFERPERYPRKHRLFEQDRPVKDIFLFAEGLVKLSHESAGGDQTVIGLRTAGEFVDLLGLSPHRSHLLSAITITDCGIHRINAEEMRNAAGRSLDLAKLLLAVHQAEAAANVTSLINLRCSKPEDRLIDLVPIL